MADACRPVYKVMGGSAPGLRIISCRGKIFGRISLTGGRVVATTVKGSGTKEKPWVLTTPSGQGEFQAYRDEKADPPALVVQVGKTELRYQLRCLEDLRAMLKKHGD